ncbi:MAG: hypothetical protein ACLQNE_14455 [Thermoguttaceae bacterium]
MKSLFLTLLLITPSLLAAEPQIRLASVATRLEGGACHWRIVALVPDDGGRQTGRTPQADVQGARLVQSSTRPPLLFLHVVADSPRVSPRLTIRLAEVPGSALQVLLPLSLNLADLPWQARWLGKDSKLAEIDAVPDTAGPWKPIRLPKEWQELGVTWVRTRVVIPAAWKGLGLRLNLGPVDDRDTTFFNGRRIGSTDGWDKPRNYAIPQDAVAWDRENEIAVAVDNVFAGGGLYRGPLELAAGEPAPARPSFAAPAQEDEVRRAPPGPVGPRLPLRRMAVHNGVLRYQDGGEVALWGVNYYPQSWEQYQSLKKLGIDHRRSMEEDFEDFQAMGLDVIRIHVFDTEITDAAGNLVRNEHLDLLDYLVAQCNRRGMYLMLTPIAWWGSPGARPDSFSSNTPKQAMSMWPAAWKIQANYLGQFLSHRNPYTGRRLVEEPCLALLEIINEPDYWTYGNIVSGDPGQTWLHQGRARRGLEGVVQEWRRFLPSSDWDSAETYTCFRYWALRRYIDTMVQAIRQTGARQPIGYFANRWGDVDDVFQAIADSRCDAITIGAYPGGLAQIPQNDKVNLLGETANAPLDARFAAKARLVYEFDASSTRDLVSMYPALARHWRNAGVQVACQFQYDARSLAHLNWDWPQHYLNLWHVPGKTASFLIGGEVFRRLPRGASFPTPPDDQVFPPAAVSFHRNAAVLAAEDCYMQARPTDWRPLPLPEQPRHVLSVGSCPYFDYAGSGIVDLRIEGKTATLRIYPDVDRVSEGLRGTVDKPLTRLVSREHPFRLRLAGWTDDKVQRQEGTKWVDQPGRVGEFTVAPGVYRLTRPTSTLSR